MFKRKIPLDAAELAALAGAAGVGGPAEAHFARAFPVINAVAAHGAEIPSQASAMWNKFLSEATSGAPNSKSALNAFVSMSLTKNHHGHRSHSKCSRPRLTMPYCRPAFARAAVSRRWQRGCRYASKLMMLFSMLVLPLGIAWAEPSLDCAHADQVHYSSPAVVPLGGRVVFMESNPFVDTFSPFVKSPQQTTLFFVVDKSDFTKKGPWHERIRVIGATPAHKVDTIIEFRDLGSDGVRFQWLDEKLLFAQAWWGRVLSTDMIIDVEKKKIIYAEEADYSGVRQCSESRDSKKR